MMSSIGPDTFNSKGPPKELSKEEKREIRRKGFVAELVKTEADYIKNLRIMSAPAILEALRGAYAESTKNNYTDLAQVEAWLKNCEMVAKAHEEHLLPVLEKFQKGEATPAQIEEAFAKVKEADERLANSYYDMVAEISGVNKDIILPPKFFQQFSEIAGQRSKEEGLNTGTSFGNYAILQAQRYARYPMQIDAISEQSTPAEQKKLKDLSEKARSYANNYDALSVTVAEKKAGMSTKEWKDIEFEKNERKNENKQLGGSSGAIKTFLERLSSSSKIKRGGTDTERKGSHSPLLLSGGPNSSTTRWVHGKKDQPSEPPPKDTTPSPLRLGGHRGS